MEIPSILITYLKPIHTGPLKPHGRFFVQPTIQLYTRVSLNALMVAGEAAWSSSLSSNFCSSLIFKPTCPNSLLFHSSNRFRHNSIHLEIGKLPAAKLPSSQAFFTISSHLGTFNHIDSNLNIFRRNCFFCFKKKRSERGE